MSKEKAPPESGEETPEVTVELEGAAKAETPKKEEKKDDTFDRLVRLTADFENFRKRVQKEKSELVRYGNEGLVRELLPVVDNFERALEHARKSSDIESLRSGVELILTQLINTFQRFGVRSQVSLGTPFDPLIHEAVSHTASDKYPPHTVMTEHQKAYFLHDHLIRPAIVTVSKEANTPSPPQEKAEEAGNGSDGGMADAKNGRSDESS